VPDHDHPSTATSEPTTGDGFVWHPTYTGQSFARVHGDLVENIGRDQRAYQLAMDGAEGSEHDALATVVELQRRWCTYEFDWAETDPRALADRILTFEQERERRQELLSFDDYRASGALVASAPVETAEPTRSLPILQIGLGILAILVIFFLIAILT